MKREKCPNCGLYEFDLTGDRYWTPEEGYCEACGYEFFQVSPFDYPFDDASVQAWREWSGWTEETAARLESIEFGGGW